MSTASLHKFYYWGAPGKGESIRLALHMTGANWEDCKLDRSSWVEMKQKLLPTFPQANLPLLEVNGKYLTESKAIMRYVGTLGGGVLIPADTFLQARMDEGMQLAEEIFSCVLPVIFCSYPDEASKMQARAALFVPGGAGHTCMEKFERIIASLNGNFYCGDQVSLADIVIFCYLNVLVCGMFDGFPTDLFNAFPAIQAYRKKVGSIAEVASRYANEVEGPLAKGFKV